MHPPNAQTFELQPIEPVDHAGVLMAGDLAELEDEALDERRQDRPAAGSEAGYPLAAMFVSLNSILCTRLFPDSPLTDAEEKELKTAAAEVEAYYAPDLSGPWWIWARLGMTATAIYGPRMASARADRKRRERDSAPDLHHAPPADDDAASPEVTRADS